MGNQITKNCTGEDQLDMVSASATGSAPYYLHKKSTVLSSGTSSQLQKQQQQQLDEKHRTKHHNKMLHARKLTAETEPTSSNEYDAESSEYFSVQSKLPHHDTEENPAQDNASDADNDDTLDDSDKNDPFHGEQLTERTLAHIPVDPKKPSFEYVKSHVTDGSTGQVCSPTKVLRGTTRLETLTFVAHQPLVRLKRKVVTSKKMGFAYIQVATEELELGNFAACMETNETTHEKEPVLCQLPPQHVPDSSLAKGQYKIHITYTAQNFGGHVLREETVEFSIV